MQLAMLSRSIPSPGRPSTGRDDTGPISYLAEVKLSPFHEGVRTALGLARPPAISG